MPAFYTACMQSWLDSALTLLALPQYGLGTLFLVSFVSATLLPLGSEPALFGLLQLNPGLFWPAIGIATLGNTLGGAVSWWMGFGASKVADKYAHSRHHLRAGLAGAAGAQGLPAEMAAHRGRPAVRRSGLAQTAVLALCGLHGDWQIHALPDDDGGAAVPLA